MVERISSDRLATDTSIECCIVKVSATPTQRYNFALLLLLITIIVVFR